MRISAQVVKGGEPLRIKYTSEMRISVRVAITVLLKGVA
jgi:hypothetical protein